MNVVISDGRKIAEFPLGQNNNQALPRASHEEEFCGMKDIYSRESGPSSVFVGATQIRSVHLQTSKAMTSFQQNKKRRLDDNGVAVERDGGERKSENPVFVGIMTVSDRCASGENSDLSGPNLQKIIKEHTGFRAIIKVSKIVPDESDEIVETLVHWSDNLNLNLIITTGGTGLGPRDVTPEATAAVIEKETPGFTIAIITASLEITTDGMLTRLKTGIRGNTLILNLPGSKKASSECLRVALPSIPHALECMRSSTDRICDCAAQDNYGVNTPKRKSQKVTTGQKLVVQTSAGGTLSKRDTNHHRFTLLEPTLTEEDIASAAAEESLLSSGIPTIDSIPRPSSEASKSAEDEENQRPALSVEEAIQVIGKVTKVLDQEEVGLIDAFGKVLADEVAVEQARTAVATVSGYALAGPASRGEIRNISAGVLLPGDSTKVRQISIGSTLTKAITAVAALKDTRLLNGNKIYLLNDVPSGQGVRYIQSKDDANLTVKKGTRLGSAEIRELTKLGATTCKTYRNPTVAVLSVGDKASEMTNHITLQLYLRQHSLKPTDLGVTAQDGELAAVLSDTIETADVFVITSKIKAYRNSSRALITKIFGATIHFERIDMLPRDTSVFATANYNGRQKLFFILPECPLGSIQCTLLLIPACRIMLGKQNRASTVIKAKISRDQDLKDSPEYLQCTVQWRSQEPIPWVENIGVGAGQHLGYDSSAILVLPEKTGQCVYKREGDTVDVILVGSV